MPRIAIVIVALAFGFFVGFLSGAFLTKPRNEEMVQLVKDKEIIQKSLEEATKQAAQLKEDLARLRTSTESLKITNDTLKNKLLESYQSTQEAKDRSLKSKEATYPR